MEDLFTNDTHVVELGINLTETFFQIYEMFMMLVPLLGFFFFIWGLFILRSAFSSGDPSVIRTERKRGTNWCITGVCLGLFWYLFMSTFASIFGGADPVTPMQHLAAAISDKDQNYGKAALFAALCIIQMLGAVFAFLGVVSLRNASEKDTGIRPFCYKVFSGVSLFGVVEIVNAFATSLIGNPTVII